MAEGHFEQTESRKAVHTTLRGPAEVITSYRIFRPQLLSVDAVLAKMYVSL